MLFDLLLVILSKKGNVLRENTMPENMLTNVRWYLVLMASVILKQKSCRQKGVDECVGKMKVGICWFHNSHSRTTLLLRSWIWLQADVAHSHGLSLHVMVRGPGGARPDYTLGLIFCKIYWTKYWHTHMGTLIFSFLITHNHAFIL